MSERETATYEVLTDQELADELKVPKALIQSACRKGKIRAFKVGDLWRITRAAAQEYKGEA